MPKIVFLVTEDWYFVSHRLPLALAARRVGYEVTVVTRCHAHYENISDAGIRVIPFVMQRRGLNPFVLIYEAWQLRGIYRQERPDIVHHVALRPVVVGAVSARFAGVSNMVSAITGMGYLFTSGGRFAVVRQLLQRILPWLLRKGRTIVQNREDLAQLEGFGLDPKCMRLISGVGVDTAYFKPMEGQETQSIVMMASRLLRDKGVMEFVEAARWLSETNVRFVLVGSIDKDNPSSIAKVDIDQWVGAGIVEWWGHSVDMAQTLVLADIVCLPSYREGLPKVLLEAMACGKACVTTDVAGCRDAVRHEDNGLLVPPGDAMALASAIKWLLDNPKRRREMGGRGRERAIREFSQQCVIEATLAIYSEMLRTGE